MKYQIYLLTCGQTKYVGSTVNFKRRFSQHLKDLKSNKHCNDKLQHEFNKGNKLKYKILQSSETLFREEILRDEQRWINKLSNSNEAVASKITNYSKKEFMQDMLDLIIKRWKLISALIITLLIVGYGMTQEQANQVIEFIVKMYHTFGG